MMERVASLIFSFWASCAFAGAVLSCFIVISPDARTSALLPLALFVFAFVCWRAGMALWRHTSSAPARLREAGVLLGPLIAAIFWSTSTGPMRRGSVISIIDGWLLFLSLTFWLASWIRQRQA